MSKNAVTEEAPAVSERVPNSNLMPRDENYRLTGNMPAELEIGGTQRDEEEHIPEGIREEREQERTKLPAGGENAGEETEQDSSTAAASEAATTQKEKGPAQSKTAKASESRWAKITRENREQRELIARLQREKTSGETTREIQPTSQPAAEAKGKARPEPQIGDIDPKTQKPKYATLGDYLADARAWDREETLRQVDERNAKTQREQAQSQNDRIIEQTVNQRVEAARKSYADYDTVIASALEAKNEHGQDAFFFSKGSPIDVFFLDSDRGQDVMYAIAKDFDQHQHIFARDAKGNFLLNPIRQLRELAKIENSLPAKGKASGATSAKPVTQAPRPPNQVSGRGTGSRDVIAEAVEEGDFESYMREQNRQALERLTKKG